VSEIRIEEEVRAALDETYRPAPELLSVSIAAIRSDHPQPRQLTWVAGVAAVLLALGSVAVFMSTRTSTRQLNPPNPTNASLPQPVPQPITRTSAAAQVAWLQFPRVQSSLVAVDPRGRLVALDRTTSSAGAGAYGVWRSAEPYSGPILARREMWLATHSVRTGNGSQCSWWIAACCDCR
jgi:hypothetical protein